jgi:hypothetical protein
MLMRIAAGGRSLENQKSIWQAGRDRGDVKQIHLKYKEVTMFLAEGFTYRNFLMDILTVFRFLRLILAAYYCR